MAAVTRRAMGQALRGSRRMRSRISMVQTAPWLIFRLICPVRWPSMKARILVQRSAGIGSRSFTRPPRSRTARTSARPGRSGATLGTAGRSTFAVAARRRCGVSALGQP